MSKFLKKSFLFVLFFTAFYCIVIILFGKFFPASLRPNLPYHRGEFGFTNSRLKEAENVDSIDVLILGSSHAYRGFDTRVFEKKGLKTFNLGTSSQTPIQTQILLNRYLDRLKPKMILYEVYPDGFCSDGVESAVDLIANDDWRYEYSNMALEINNIKVYNCLLYKSLSTIFGLEKPLIEPQIMNQDNFVKGGFVSKQLQHFHSEVFPKQIWKLNQKQLLKLDDLIAIFKHKNIPFLLVYAPISSTLYNSYTNQSTIDSLMKTKGLYINLNQAFPLDDSLHFYDAHHLNQNGVELMNENFIEKYFLKKTRMTDNQNDFSE